jgi:hypothetical protein
MEIHGTRADESIPPEWEAVDELREVTFVLSPDEMRMVAEFFVACANEADAEHFGDLEHQHLVDFLWKRKFSGPDIVVWRDKALALGLL